MAAAILVSDEQRKEIAALAKKLGFSNDKGLLDFVLRLLRVIADGMDRGRSQNDSYTPEQQKKLAEWLAQHDKTCAYRDNQGAVGGRLTYLTTPTSLGSVEEVACACGAKINLTDYDSW